MPETDEHTPEQPPSPLPFGAVMVVATADAEVIPGPDRQVEADTDCTEEQQP